MSFWSKALPPFWIEPKGRGEPSRMTLAHFIIQEIYIMKVNYSLEESKEESENNDKIPKNISIRTMQSDLLRLKELAKGKEIEK